MRNLVNVRSLLGVMWVRNLLVGNGDGDVAPAGFGSPPPDLIGFFHSRAFTRQGVATYFPNPFCMSRRLALNWLSRRAGQGD